MKNIDSPMVEICILKKYFFLRISLCLIIMLFVVLVHFKVSALIMLLFITLPSIIWLILIQIMEKVESIGYMLFNTERIIIKQHQSEHIINYQEIKSIKLKGSNIKGDTIGFFYFKKGCNNWITIYDNNNLKHKYQIQINNEIQYRMLRTKIKEINERLV